MGRLLALALQVAGIASCSDDAGRPPPPPDVDAAPLPDAAPEDDAGGARDASADANDGAGSETVHRDYGTDFETCPSFQYPVWGDLRWEATIPDGASIRFSAQAAPAGESLSGAQRVTLGTTPPATSPIYVSDELPAAHRNDPQLRITAELRWPTPEARPTLVSQNLDWVCLDRE